PVRRYSCALRIVRRSVEDRLDTRRSRLPTVSDAWQRAHAFFDQRRRRLHVDDFRAARIANRAGTADEQHGVLVDLERGIFDAAAAILRPVIHHGPGLESIEVLRVGHVSDPEILAHAPRLPYHGLEQTALPQLDTRLI